jgi:HK97 gp10 family phage protein
MASFNIEGLDPILKKMKGLSQKMQQAGVRRAGLKAMRLVRDDARARAKQFDDPSTPNNIPKNIVVRNNSKAGKRVGGVVIQVGVLGGAKSERSTRGKNASNDSGSKIWYWRFLEFGTSKMRAQPFMRPALANNVEKVTTSMVTSLNTEIDKIIAKGG